ncbi:unnamed protein product [Ranitomeya imitator]|uniref:Alpha-amylase n=1 Tax=Ranitomeya imitator TaxID=111125 RepID=A0ABN9L3H6_9NEOB|nr:unnamed protein product [Ranitomeya imitator]
MKLLLLLVAIGLCSAQYNPNTKYGRTSIVHLFEWRWDDIAEECERYLGPNGFGGIQICCNLSTTESTPGQSKDSTCPEEKRGWNPELQKNGETKVAELARLLRANSANGKKDTQSSWSAETKHLRYVSKV